MTAGRALAGVAGLVLLLIGASIDTADAKRLEGPAVDVHRNWIRIVDVDRTRNRPGHARDRFRVRLNDGSVYRTRGCATRRCPRPDATWTANRGGRAFARLRWGGKAIRVYWQPRGSGGTVGDGPAVVDGEPDRAVDDFTDQS